MSHCTSSVSGGFNLRPGWLLGLAIVLGGWAGRMEPSATAQTASGNPNLVLQREFPAVSEWLPTGALGFRVEILHPYAGGGSAPVDWRAAPAGGWGAAMRLQVTDSTGAEVGWPFRISAPGLAEPLTISPLMTAGATFWVTPAGFTPPPRAGTYRVRAVLEVTSGDGWRGRVTSAALPVVVLSLPGPRLAIEPVVDGPLVQGVPWGFRATLSNPDRPGAKMVQMRGGGMGWPTNTQIVVRDEAGAVVAWNWASPRLPYTENRFLRPGESFATAYYRLPGTNTSSLPAGRYSLVARYASTVQDPVFDYWLGTIESDPLEIVVLSSVIPEDPGSLARRFHAEAEDALEQARSLRVAADEPGLSSDRRLALTRQAAVPLMQAESAAQQWFLATPTSVEPALLLSRILTTQDDKLRAVGWLRMAMAVDAANPGTEPGAPNAEEGTPNPFLLASRQEVEALPDVPNTQLSPELLFTLDLARGSLPDPTNFAQQDKYYLADPRGQWAVSAKASSEYRATSYSASRATGVPDVNSYGDNQNSWATKLADAPNEWIELTFGQPTRAGTVRVRQTFNPGAIAKVELLDTDGAWSTVFQGTDTNVYPRATMGWFLVSFSTTAKPIVGVRLSLDSVRVAGWNEIDAVQLVAGTVTPVTPPRLEFEPFVPGSSRLVISAWPDGFMLERATRLVPPDWQKEADRPPATVPFDAGAGFFRLVETR